MLQDLPNTLLIMNGLDIEKKNSSSFKLCIHIKLYKTFWTDKIEGKPPYVVCLIVQHCLMGVYQISYRTVFLTLRFESNAHEFSCHAHFPISTLRCSRGRALTWQHRFLTNASPLVPTNVLTSSTVTPSFPVVAIKPPFPIPAPLLLLFHAHSYALILRTCQSPEMCWLLFLLS